jgi:hypothetical protein
VLARACSTRRRRRTSACDPPRPSTVRKRPTSPTSSSRPPQTQREVLHFGGGGPQTQAGLGGFKVSLDAIGGLRRQTLKAGGIPESIAVSDPEREEIIDNLLPTTLLGRAATLADVGNVAAWAASDQVHDHRHRDQHLLRCDRRLGGNAVNLRQVIAHLAGLTVGGTLLLWDGADQESGRLVQKVVESDTAEAIKGCDS